MTSSSNTHVLKLGRALRYVRLARSSTATSGHPRSSRNPPIDQNTGPLVKVPGSAPTAQATPAKDSAPAKKAPETRKPEIVAGLLESLSESLDQFAASRRETSAIVHQIAVELAVTVAGKVLFQQIQADQFPIEKMVVEMLAQIDPTGPVTVFVNPLDLSLVQQTLNANDKNTTAVEAVKWIGNPELPRGSARLDTDKVALFYDAATQLSEIRQSLMEMLHDAEIERRKTQVGGPGLRRFPDRRSSG